MTAGRQIDLVIFDCDGVLIDSEVISTRAIVNALSALGYDIGEVDAARRFIGRSYAAVRDKVEADMGRPLPAAFEAEVERRTLEEMAGSLEPIDGIGDVLATLDRPRCVASSSSVEWITLGLRTTGLLEHLHPHLFSASMVENGKPAPDIFLHAAKQMGVAPSKTLVIEDSLPGVQAGVAAGAAVVGFTGGSHIVDKADHGGRLTTAGAMLVIDSMHDLAGIVAG